MERSVHPASAFLPNHAVPPDPLRLGVSLFHFGIWHERLGQSVDEIAATHDLTHAGIHAALAYSFDHLREIDDSLHASEAWVETMKKAMALTSLRAQPWCQAISTALKAARGGAGPAPK